MNDREIPKISLQYLFAVALLDGDVGSAVAHDVGRMSDPDVDDLRFRISVVGDE